MPNAQGLPPITALVYADSREADLVLHAVALCLTGHGWHLAGAIQHNQPRPGQSRCDMILEELAGGATLVISEDRGPHARGCVLDVGQLVQAVEAVRGGLSARTDLVILNKFGKSEDEGGGFRSLIAEIIDRGLPLLIGVPQRNLEGWRAFVGDFAVEHDLAGLPREPEALCAALGFSIPAVPPIP